MENDVVAERVEGVIPMIWKAVYMYNRLCRFDDDVLGDMFGDVACALSSRAERYDPKHRSGAKFSTFARPYIYDKAYALFKSELGRRSRAPRSMDVRWHDGRGRTVGRYDFIPDKIATSCELFGRRELRSILVKAFGALGPMDKRIVFGYYLRGMRDPEIKRKWGLPMTISAVSLRRRNALKKMKMELWKYGSEGDYLMAS
jgi:RNA polymerase sigma factor (sigma-70 family)